MSKIINRIYNDYFMKNRYAEYENLIKKFIKKNYKFIRVCDYKELLNKEKHVIIRHDVDSDVRIAKKMFMIEKKYNIKSTFYFRRSTIDKDFMNEINVYGSEIGYHYEEISTYVKENKITSKSQVMDKIEIIRNMLATNIQEFENSFLVTLKSIASHGDFINRKYKIENTILFNKKLRKKFPNIIEAYDNVVEKNIDNRISDCMYPKFWNPDDPEVYINGESKNILLLIHTRWWDKNPRERIKIEIDRILKR